LNFIIANRIVLVPKYYKEGDRLSIKEKDEEAMKIFRKVFGGRKVIQIDVRELNYGGGGMHCATSHQPAVKKQY
jgi:agmatine deiminase